MNITQSQEPPSEPTGSLCIFLPVEIMSKLALLAQKNGQHLDGYVQAALITHVQMNEYRLGSRDFYV